MTGMPPVAGALVVDPPFPAVADELEEPEEPPAAEEPPLLVFPPAGLVVAGLVDPPLLGAPAVVLAHAPVISINPHRPAATVSRQNMFAPLAEVKAM
jgi:hypothetical protein